MISKDAANETSITNMALKVGAFLAATLPSLAVLDRGASTSWDSGPAISSPDFGSTFGGTDGGSSGGASSSW